MKTKEDKRIKRHGKVRKRITGTPERPRLCVHRSLTNLYVQIVDDTKAQTICSFSTLSKGFAKSAGKVTKVAAAEKLGELSAGEIKKKGITQIAFDRGGYKYHGRIKALAESLRKAGIDF